MKIRDKNIRGYRIMGESVCRNCITDDDFLRPHRLIPLMREPMRLSGERHRCKRCGKRILRAYCYKEYRRDVWPPVPEDRKVTAII